MIKVKIEHFLNPSLKAAIFTEKNVITETNGEHSDVKI